MRTSVKVGLGLLAAVVLVGGGGEKRPKDCGKDFCTSEERLAARDAVEAKEAEKAHSFGMGWHSFQMKLWAPR